MIWKMLDTPILFLSFNRVDITEKIRATIKKVQSKQLFIAADGPRSGRKGAYAKC